MIKFKTLFTVMMSDFNAKSKTWCTSDNNMPEGTRLKSLKSCLEFQKLIAKPTHTLQNSASCIDLIFTRQPNLVLDSP